MLLVGFEAKNIPLMWSKRDVICGFRKLLYNEDFMLKEHLCN